jgi:photosystem II stability/assembly factor-like uncharacterized protein
MSKFLRIVLIATLYVTPCLAQTGTVTFYTPRNTVKSEAAGVTLPRSRQPFNGWVFDGPQRLAHMHVGRFMTFHLNPGTHSFTVPWRAKGPGKDSLVINVEDGGHYCIRLSAKLTNVEVLPFGFLNSKIEEVSCQQAQHEAMHLKPIDSKRIDPAVRAELDPATTFPGDGQPPQ